MAKGRKTGGRKAGTPNKLTRTVREAFVEAFALVNEAKPLHEWGAANPDKFYPLAIKLVPIDIVSGGEPLKPSGITIQLVDPSEQRQGE